MKTNKNVGLMPEVAARAVAGILLVVNGLLFWKRVLLIYTASFKDQPA